MANAKGLSSEIQQLNTRIETLENKANPKDSPEGKEQLDSLKDERREKRIEFRDTTQSLIPRLNFHTEKDCAVFYAKDEGKEAAKALCDKHPEYRTLETTAGGQWLEGLRMYDCLSERNARNVSAAASIEYAYASSGVTAVCGRTAHKDDSILWKDEVPALYRNKENAGIRFNYPPDITSQSKDTSSPDLKVPSVKGAALHNEQQKLYAQIKEQRQDMGKDISKQKPEEKEYE